MECPPKLQYGKWLWNIYSNTVVKWLWNIRTSAQTPVWEVVLKHLLKNYCGTAVEHPSKLLCGKWLSNVYSNTTVKQLWNIHQNWCDKAVKHSLKLQRETATQTHVWNSCGTSIQTCVKQLWNLHPSDCMKQLAVKVPPMCQIKIIGDRIFLYFIIL